MTAALRDGEIWVAGFNGSIDGAAIWIQPGKEEPTLDRPDYFAQLSDQTRRWIVQHFSLVYRELYASAYAAGPIIRTQSWHLGFIGVLPQLQRRGLGRALVNAVIANAGHAEYPVTVDASVLSSVYFLQSLGFVHRGVKNFTCPKGSFPLWCLMRPPTSTRGSR
ncbi:unnamed protein product [Peniophora sp. CBMAI 1063]|nr:unnamed protein product [Peniophora sp. CBMAI 1063]